MLDTKIFDTQEVLQDRFETNDTTKDFLKSTSFLFLVTTSLTIAVCLQTMHLLQGPFPLLALVTLSIIALSYFYSIRASILLLLSIIVTYGLSSALAITPDLLPEYSSSFFGTQALLTLGSIILATYSRVIKTSLKWQEKLSHFAKTHDDLTLLQNRGSFTEKLDAIIFESESNQERFALVLIDINGLQNINQQHGYKAGNAALHMLSDRLRQVAQQDDLIARIDDDCFALVVHNMAHNAQLNSYIGRVTAMLNLPFDYAWTKISLDTKIASSFYPLDGKTAQELLTLNIEKLG